MLRFLLFLVGASFALAMPLDTTLRYDVVKVLPNDRLYVRQAPNPNAERVGSFAHDALGVRITGKKANYGRYLLSGNRPWG